MQLCHIRKRAQRLDFRQSWASHDRFNPLLDNASPVLCLMSLVSTKRWKEGHWAQSDDDVWANLLVTSAVAAAHQTTDTD